MTRCLRITAAALALTVASAAGLVAPTLATNDRAVRGPVASTPAPTPLRVAEDVVVLAHRR